MESKKTDAYTTLVNYNIKPSVQRIEIMKYLLTHHTHPTVEDVYSALHKKIPTLSKTTVYNTLKLFSEQGAALMLTIDEKSICFDGDTSPHAHFMCKDCGKIFDLLFTEEGKEIPGFVAYDHLITEIHYYYKGFCNKCLTKQ